MAKKIELMGHFTAIHMRKRVDDPTGLVINTCGGNGTANKGDVTRWDWSNPTNTKYQAVHSNDPTITAISIECLWQGTKIFQAGDTPNQAVLDGDWRKGKAKRPIGAWNGQGNPLLDNPGDARRTIYIPAFRNQIESWIRDDADVADWVQIAREHDGNVYLRDHDTGRGVNRRGPMSHAWVLAVWLNTGEWPNA